MYDWWKSSASNRTPVNPTNSRVKVLPLKIGKKSSQFNLIQFTSGISCEFEKGKEIFVDKVGVKGDKTESVKSDISKESQTTHSRKSDDESFTLTYTGLDDRKRKFKGTPEAGVNDNSSFFVLRMVEGKYMEAYPLNNWISYSPTNTFKTLDYDRAQKEYENRNKHYSRWYLRAKLNSEDATSSIPGADNSLSADSKRLVEDVGIIDGEVTNKSNSKLLLTEADEWVDSDNDCNSENNDEPTVITNTNPKPHAKVPGKVKSKSNFKKALMSKELGTRTGRFRRPAEKVNSESEFTEESDDGDRDADEFDYSDDSSSVQSEDSAAEDERGIDQEIRPQTVTENNESEPDEEDNVLTEEGKELVRLLNEFDTMDQSVAPLDDSDLSSSGSSSEFEEKMEQSLKSSRAFRLLNESQQKPSISSQSQQKHHFQQNHKQSSKSLVKRTSSLNSSSMKPKRVTKKNKIKKTFGKGN